MLTGHPPRGRFESASEVNTEVTEAVDVLIDHARERSADKRFASAREMRDEIGRISLVLVKGQPNQYLRVGLAWLSKRYEQLTSRKWLAFLLLGLVALMALSVIPSLPMNVSLLARLLTPLLLNSLLVSILFDWIVRTIARRRGLGSLIASGGGMGAILGLMFTLHLIRILGPAEILKTSQILSFFASILTFALFETALSLGIMLAVARGTERIFKSYTTGFYWSFVTIVVIELILTVLGQPAGLIVPAPA